MSKVVLLGQTSLVDIARIILTINIITVLFYTICSILVIFYLHFSFLLSRGFFLFFFFSWTDLNAT